MIKVSVVTPVYNVEKYLPRCLETLLGQTLSELEIICVDDGSTDGSGRILDEYAARDPRIRVIHKPNGGAGEARNVGLDAAIGEYLFFCDPDDSCSKNMLAGMYAKAVATRADIVIAGKATVDADSGRIISKYGFHRDIWRLRQPFSARDAAPYIFTLAKSVPWDKLFRREFISRNGLRYQNTRRCNDVFFVDMALAQAERIALVPRAYYRYSLDRAGSLQSNKDKFPLVFLDAYAALEAALREKGLFDDFGHCFARVFLRTSVFNLRALKERENVIRCYQMVRERLLSLSGEHDLPHDMLLSRRMCVLAQVILTNERPDAFLASVAKGGVGFDDEGDGHDARISVKTLFRRLFRRYAPVPAREFIKICRCYFQERILRRDGGIPVELLAQKNGLVRLDFLDVSARSIRLDMSYYSRLPSVPECLPGNPFLVVSSASGERSYKLVPGECCAMREKDAIGVRSKGRRFSVAIDLAPGERQVLRWAFPSGAQIFTWSFVKSGLYCGLSLARRNACCFASGWQVRRLGDELEIRPETRSAHFSCGLHGFCEAVRHPSLSVCKAGILRVSAWLVRKFRRRPLWLVSDRPDRADDNGRAFFEYVASLPPSAERPECVFAIKPGSPDYAALSRIGRCVDPDGFRYKVLFLVSDFIISAYRTKVQRMPFSKHVAECLSDYFANRFRFVCLRHGISQNDQADDIGRAQLNARLLVSASAAERKSILEGRYGYSEREVVLCGMTRYDKLYDDPKGYVTLMPTWRSYLTAGAGTNQLIDRESFSSSPFCKGWKALLSDSGFVEECGRHGFKVRIMMHPNMRDSLSELGICPGIEILPADVSYRDVFATSNLVVTDYSSVAFDVAYLKKPVLYYQFDREDFFGAQYIPGYFECSRDGFGEVETEAGAIKARILEYAAAGCRMKPEYVKRVENFFAFTDKNNCKRVYEAILKADAEDRARS